MSRAAVAGAASAALALVAISIGSVVALIHAVEETLTSADLIPWDDQD